MPERNTEDHRRTDPVDSKFVINVDSISGGKPSGTFSHMHSRQSYPFTGFDSLILQMEQLLDQLNHPQRYFEERHWERKNPPAPESLILEDSPVDSNRSGKMATFVVFVMMRQHGTWQGEVTWIERKKKVYFRSALELLELLENALPEGRA